MAYQISGTNVIDDNRSASLSGTITFNSIPSTYKHLQIRARTKINATGNTYDAMVDVPTLTSANVANYCVQNPLTISIANPSTLVWANMLQTGNSGGYFQGGIQGTIGMATGKFYWEVTAISLYTTNGYFAGGIATENYYPQNYASNDYGPGGPSSSGVSGVGTGALYYPSDTGSQ